jgi:DNA polymerase sigma
MSSRCEITGLSKEDAKLFEYLHSQLTGKLEINEPEKEIISSFGKPLENTVSNNRGHKSDARRRENLLKHLQKSVASKFSNSKLTPFGSAESDLALKGADFDLCL